MELSPALTWRLAVLVPQEELAALEVWSLAVYGSEVPPLLKPHFQAPPSNLYEYPNLEMAALSPSYPTDNLTYLVLGHTFPFPRQP